MVDAQSADVWFEPDPSPSGVRARASLGLLGRIAEDACMLEPYHAAPRLREMRNCVRKLLSHQHGRELEADRRGVPCPPLARVWVISSTLPRRALARFGLTRIAGWPGGCLQGPPEYGLRDLVLRDLPRVRGTLLLRLLGAGEVLRLALAELARLPPDALERVIAVPELIARRMEMPQDAAELTREERDFRMSTQELYEQWRRKVEKTGEKRGLKQGLQKGLIAAYGARFGAVPEALATAIRSTRDAETLQQWFGLVATGSPDEIAAGILAPPRARG